MLYQNCTTTPRSFQLSAWLPSTFVGTPFVYGFTDVDIKAKLALRGTEAAKNELKEWRRSQAGTWS
jgi:hypothetical protein